MDELTKIATNPFLMWFYGAIGDALLIVGIVTAVMNVTIGGFTPMLWFLLAIPCYLGLIWVVALRILANLEKQAGS